MSFFTFGIHFRGNIGSKRRRGLSKIGGGGGLKINNFWCYQLEHKIFFGIFKFDFYAIECRRSNLTQNVKIIVKITTKMKSRGRKKCTFTFYYEIFKNVDGKDLPLWKPFWMILLWEWTREHLSKTILVFSSTLKWISGRNGRIHKKNVLNPKIQIQNRNALQTLEWNSNPKWIDSFTWRIWSWVFLIFSKFE